MGVTGQGIASLCPNKVFSNGTPCSVGNGYASIFAAEFIATFIFVSVILQVKYHQGAKFLGLNAINIGATLFVMILTIGGISGGCLNPAVGIVQQTW